MTHDYSLDLSGQSSPEPLLHVEAYVRQLRPGDRLEIELTDPLAADELEAWADTHRHYLATEQPHDGHIRLLLEVGE